MMFIEGNEPFPDPENTDDDGLLAIGGDLSPNRLLSAYRSGIFPWFREDGHIFWYSPPQRLVLYPASIKVTSSMKRVLNSKQFIITNNLDFNGVINSCSNAHMNKSNGTWIDEEFIKAYSEMNRIGYATSFEVWQEKKLIGGMYGVKMGKVFCGESMFSKVSNASKAALIYLCRSHQYSMIDCQVPSNHLISLGAEIIPRARFLRELEKLKGME